MTKVCFELSEEEHRDLGVAAALFGVSKSEFLARLVKREVAEYLELYRNGAVFEAPGRTE